MARRKAQNPYGSCLAARGRLPARHKRSSSEAIAHAHLRRLRHRALLSSGPSRSECADRSVSQLLAGTPSGPGGSSNAARVPRCDEARRRRTPSRLTTPHETPLSGRGGGSICEVWEAGIMRGQRCTHSRHPLVGEGFQPRSCGKARIPLAGRVRGDLFRRAFALTPHRAPRARALPQGESGEFVAPLRQATLGTGLRRHGGARP